KAAFGSGRGGEIRNLQPPTSNIQPRMKRGGPPPWALEVGCSRLVVRLSQLSKINTVINTTVGHDSGDLERLASFEAERTPTDLAAQPRLTLHRQFTHAVEPHRRGPFRRG